MFLPAARGFDRYLGIPYSADMGDARATPCAAGQPERTLCGTYPRLLVVPRAFDDDDVRHAAKFR